MKGIMEKEKVCIYGCGTIGREAYVYYKEKKDTEISFLCDSDSNKWNTIYQGMKILSPQMLANRIEEVDYIIIATVYVDEVILTLGGMGIDISKIRVYKSEVKQSIEYNEIYRNHSWSQDGEDIWLQERFRDRNGFYVDVGALHPFRFSNTAWAYDQGWKGINIEPNLDCFRLFEMLRPNDININCGISDEEGELTYYCFEEPALNGFYIDAHTDFPIREERHIKVRRLADILHEHNVKKVDFLDIDVEGLEMKVLNSIDFSVDIECILLEQHISFEFLTETPEYEFLNKMGYRVAAKYGRTTIYEK